MSKRYILFRADADLTDEDLAMISSAVREKYGSVKVIPLTGNPRAVVFKTSEVVSRLIRGRTDELRAGRKLLTSVLTSGSIGKLKSRASGPG